MASSFHAVVARRAWGRTVAEVLGQTTNDRLIRFLAFAITAALSWGYFTYVEPRSEELSAVATAAILSVAAVVAAFLFVLIVNLFYLVPAAIFREQQREITELAAWRTPRLTAETYNEGKPYDLGEYESIQTQGGDYQVNMPRRNPNICLLIRNSSALKAETVQARLVKLDGDNGRSLRDSYVLHWWQGDPGEYWADIGPGGGVRTLPLFKKTKDGFQLAGGKRVPPDYMNMLLDGTVFSGKIAIMEEHHGALEVNFVLNTEEQKLTIVGTGAIDAG